MPARAARPDATARASGVAMPSAHGHVTTKSAVRWTGSCAGSSHNHSPAVSAASASTAKTNTPPIRSAQSTTGARCASPRSTQASSRPTRVPSPTAVARTRSGAARLVVPASAASPSATASGRASPVSAARSSRLSPRTTTPSTGSTSPAGISTTSPTARSSTSTTSTRSPLTRRATRGTSASSRSDASPASRRLRSWSQRAVRSAAIRTATESNQTSPCPVIVAQALCPAPTAIPSAMGVSRCRCRTLRARTADRAEAHARRKNGAAP